MNESIIHSIFSKHGIEQVDFIEKIEVGFTNTVFSINDKFILKICHDFSNESRFDKEVFFYNYFKGKIPIPDVVIYDRSKVLCEHPYIIYHKIEGDNLYARWHLFQNEERKKIVKEICDYLRIINGSSLEKYTKRFEVQSDFSWKDKVVERIENSLKILEQGEMLHKDIVSECKSYILRHQATLQEQDIRIVHWDIHFDNVLISKNRVSAILDFERTELCSIDFVLDVIRRMVTQPTKYISAEYEKYVKAEDYANLLDWFREFYPELFEFSNLGKRLDIYSILHSLETLIYWPGDDGLTNIITSLIREN